MFVKRIQKAGVALTVMTLCMLLGPAPAEWAEVRGETKGPVTMPHESTRDPFLFPPGIYPLSKTDRVLSSRRTSLKSETKPADLSWRLTAILISDHVRLASIDRYILTVGDFIYGERVLEIQSDRVILGKGANRRTLLLSQNSLRLKVEEK